jgi:oligopeptide/dipeptide ABC transporter ATP-binding protein
MSAASAAPAQTALLKIENLVVRFATARGYARAVDGVSFEIRRGENFGLVGESGCGKTTIAKAIIRLLPENGRIAEGKILHKGIDLTGLSAEGIRRIRWKEISMISQSAMNSLDPVYTVGAQIVEAIRTHDRVGVADAGRRAAALFDLVGLRPSRLAEYPHQFSGGMKQRAIIAMALAHSPGLIIADEPTTALDVIMQSQVLRRINDIRARTGSSMLMITHDISVIAETCERMAVMYAGRVAEVGTVAQVLKSSSHPYTLGLRNAFPSVRGALGDLVSIPGFPPSLIDPPPGCRFAERCPFVLDRCWEEAPRAVEVGPGHLAACHRAGEAAELAGRAREHGIWERTAAATGQREGVRP